MCATVIVMQMELHHKLKCVDVSADKAVNTLVLFLFYSANVLMNTNLCHFCQHLSYKIGFVNCLNRPVVDFSNVKSSGRCTRDLKGHKHKLSPEFNTSVIISIKMTLIVMMAVMGHLSANETDFIYFPEGDFKMVIK